MSYNFGKSEKNQKIIKIFVGVKYDQKDDAKKKGAFWDVENKRWYFKYPINDFLTNEDLHTFKYKPYDFKFPGDDNEETAKQLRITYFEILKNRNLKYIE
jgi:hypothetical protein